jgi:hypothetical protein
VHRPCNPDVPWPERCSAAPCNRALIRIRTGSERQRRGRVQGRLRERSSSAEARGRRGQSRTRRATRPTNATRLTRRPCRYGRPVVACCFPKPMAKGFDDGEPRRACSSHISLIVSSSIAFSEQLDMRHPPSTTCGLLRSSEAGTERQASIRLPALPGRSPHASRAPARLQADAPSPHRGRYGR